MFDWLYSLVSPDLTTNLTLKWIAVDVAYCLVLKRLRIPRLNYAGVAVLLQIFSLCMVDGILFGTVRVSSVTIIRSTLYGVDFCVTSRLESPHIHCLRPRETSVCLLSFTLDF